MKYALVFSILMLGPVSSFAHSVNATSIQMQPGSIREIGDFTVECLEDPVLSSPYRYAIFSRLPSSELIRVLKRGGLGSCRIATLSGNFEFFHSNRFPGGVSLTSGMHPHGIAGFIRDAMTSGECE